MEALVTFCNPQQKTIMAMDSNAKKKHQRTNITRLHAPYLCGVCEPKRRSNLWQNGDNDAIFWAKRSTLACLSRSALMWILWELQVLFNPPCYQKWCWLVLNIIYHHHYFMSNNFVFFILADSVFDSWPCCISSIWCPPSRNIMVTVWFYCQSDVSCMLISRSRLVPLFLFSE